MCRPPGQRSEFHDGYEASQVVDLSPLVVPKHHAGQVEQLGSLIDLCPESVFESFLGLLQRLVVLHTVQMGEDAHDARKTVDLGDVEKLKGLHLKTKTGID